MQKNQEEIDLSHVELSNYFSDFLLASTAKKEIIRKMKPKAFWAMEGGNKYPHLAEFARKLFTIPCSSAAAERSWNVFGTIHTKKRNRLSTETEEKLVFVYANMALCYDEDENDYAAQPDIIEFLEQLTDNEEENEETEITEVTVSDSE